MKALRRSAVLLIPVVLVGLQKCRPSPETVSGVAAYGELLKEELDIQDARKASLEQRGLAVVTTAGALATLLFALAALSTKSQTFVLPHAAQVWLRWALISFVVAAVFALMTNVPMRYDAVTADAIRGRLLATPMKDKAAAEKDIALTRVKALRDAKSKNGRKAWFLLFAMLAEVLAVGCVARAVWIII
jgi:hypothetical protein